MKAFPRLSPCPRLAALILAGSLAALLASPSARASSGTWLNTGAANGTWSTTSNWVSVTVPGSTSGITNLDTATFQTAVGTFGTSGSPVLIDANRNLKSITFTGAAGNYTIGTTGGTPLLLTSGGTIQISGGLTATNATETLNAPLVLEGSFGYTLTNNSASGTGARAGTLNFGGGITSATGSGYLFLNGSNTNANTLSGIIGNGAATPLNLSKSGTGTWVLNGQNTFTGIVQLDSGTLRVNSVANSGLASALGAGNSIHLGRIGTATLQFTGASGGATNRPIFLEVPPTAAGCIIQNTVAGQTLTLSGPVSIGTYNTTGLRTQNLELTGVGNGVSSGNVSDLFATIGLIKSGSGTWTLSGTNRHSGATTVSGGVLKIGNSNALGFGGVQRATTPGTVVNSGFTLDLNGTASIQEPIALNGTGLGGNGALVNNSGTAASIGNGIAGLAVPLAGSGSGYSAAPAVVISGTGTGATATASLGLTTASITSASGGSGWVTGDLVLFDSSFGLPARGTVTASAGAITAITITDAGTVFTSGPSTITRVTGAGTGGTVVGNATNFTVGGISMTNAGTGYTGTPTFTIGGVAAPAVTATLSSVNLATTSSLGGSGDTTIAGVVSGAGLSKVGAGTLTLTAANTYTGNTAVTQGKLTLSGLGTFASSPDIAVGSGATLDVTGVTGGASWDGTRFAVASGQTLHGTGTVLGALDVSAGGTIAAGNSIGTLGIAGLSLTSATSHFALEIDLSVVPAADLLNVSGAVSLNGSTLDLSLFNLSPLSVPATYLFAANDLADVVSGTFGTINGVPMGFTATVNYAFSGTDTLGRIGDGNDLAVVIDLEAIPEPGTAVWGMAVSLLACGRRRRVRRSAVAQ